jgi:xylulokinase
VLEGVAFAFRQMLEILKENGALVNEIVAINGGARSLLWRQILADVLQVPIRWRPTKDGTTLGGAYLAALGAGLFNRFEDITAWLEPTIDTFPNLANVDIYQRRYAVYAGLYDKLKSDFLALRQ